MLPEQLLYQLFQRGQLTVVYEVEGLQRTTVSQLPFRSARYLPAS